MPALHRAATAALGQSCHWRPTPADVLPVREGRGAALRGPRGPVVAVQRAQPRALPLPAARCASGGTGSSTWPRCATAGCGFEGWKAIAAVRPRPTATRCCSARPRPSARPWTRSTRRSAWTSDGRPFRGRMKRLHGLPEAAAAPHRRLRPPSLQQASARARCSRASHTKDSLPIAYVSRLGRLMRTAERHGRIPRSRGIYLTEFGFQTNPPDRKRGQSLTAHARSINQADRLFFADPAGRGGGAVRAFDAPEPETQRRLQHRPAPASTGRSSPPGAPTGCRWWWRKLGRGRGGGVGPGAPRARAA